VQNDKKAQAEHSFGMELLAELGAGKRHICFQRVHEMKLSAANCILSTTPITIHAHISHETGTMQMHPMLEAKQPHFRHVYLAKIPSKRKQNSISPSKIQVRKRSDPFCSDLRVHVAAAERISIPNKAPNSQTTSYSSTSPDLIRKIVFLFRMLVSFSFFSISRKESKMNRSTTQSFHLLHACTPCGVHAYICMCICMHACGSTCVPAF
jgi:hypothetical protein